MKGFAYTSYKHRRDQELLRRFSDSIFHLKLQAQHELERYGLGEQDAQESRARLVDFLARLEACVRLLAATSADGDADLTFTGLADRFVQANPADVADRLADLRRVREELSAGQMLNDRAFSLLDDIQALLQEEAAEGVRSLYRL
jgi:hypothetical protein